jgi:hypothetical protein
MALLRGRIIQTPLSILCDSTARGYQVRTLVYPEGFGAGRDGGLRVVPGGHLYRQARLEPSSAEAGETGYDAGRAPVGWAATDEAFAEHWLAGKAHPITGAPLRIAELSLPPGSMVSCLSHCPHAVSPKVPGQPTRYCTLFCYGAPDPAGALPRSSERETWSLPAEYERRAVAGELAARFGPQVGAGPSNFFTRY